MCTAKKNALPIIKRSPVPIEKPPVIHNKYIPASAKSMDIHPLRFTFFFKNRPRMGTITIYNVVKKPDFPILAYTDLSIFKIYMVDIGLLGAMSNLSAKVILEGDRLFEEFKGAITEQYVLQQLVIKKDIDVLYWAEEKATAEVDFVVQLDNVIVPIEVKATENLRAKSLKRFVDKYNNQYAIRTSMSDYREQEWMTNVPLYCIEDLEHKNCD